MNRAGICHWFMPTPIAATTPWARSSASAGYACDTACSQCSSGSWISTMSTASSPRRVRLSSNERRTLSREKSNSARSSPVTETGDRPTFVDTTKSRAGRRPARRRASARPARDRRTARCRSAGRRPPRAACTAASASARSSGGRLPNGPVPRPTDPRSGRAMAVHPSHSTSVHQRRMARIVEPDDQVGEPGRVRPRRHSGRRPAASRPASAGVVRASAAVEPARSGSPGRTADRPRAAARR